MADIKRFIKNEIDHAKPVDTINPKDGSSLNLVALPITEDEENTANLTPPCIVENYLFVDLAQIVAAGGSGKTTLVLYEMVHISLQRPLWGRAIYRSGQCLFITAEDSREICVARLKRIMDALELTPQERETARQNILILDVTGVDCRLVHTMDDIVLTDLPDLLIEAYKNNPPVLIVFDPMGMFGASERAVNDNEQALVRAARRIIRGLNCCVRYIHHTGQTVARDKLKDQYAGRGGSALSDGARMVSVLHKWSEIMGRLPSGLNVDDDILVLSNPKLSYSPNQPDIFIKRQGYKFDFVHLPPPIPIEDEINAQKDQLFRFIASKLNDGIYLNKTSLAEGYLSQIDMTSRETKTALAQLMSEGRITNTKLPADERQGSRTTYLNPTPTKFVDSLSEYAENKGKNDDF